jgi:hypothetical protein
MDGDHPIVSAPFAPPPSLLQGDQAYGTTAPLCQLLGMPGLRSTVHAPLWGMALIWPVVGGKMSGSSDFSLRP